MGDKKGFTLIEVLVVLAIIAIMMAVAMPRIASYFKVSLNSAARDMANAIKEAYNASVLTGRIYRIVYDMKENTFWVESSLQGTLLHTQESLEKQERRRRFGEKPKVKDQPSFLMDKGITRKKMPLPRGVTYEDIVTQKNKEPITTGQAYTHFFPHGITEQTVVHLKDTSQHRATLAITPLLGMTDLYDRYVNSAEILEPKKK